MFGSPCNAFTDLQELGAPAVKRLPLSRLRRRLEVTGR